MRTPTTASTTRTTSNTDYAFNEYSSEYDQAAENYSVHERIIHFLTPYHIIDSASRAAVDMALLIHAGTQVTDSPQTDDLDIPPTWWLTHPKIKGLLAKTVHRNNKEICRYPSTQPAGYSRKSQHEAAAVQVREERVTAAAVRNASDDVFQAHLP
jgi:hypothetical protein